MGDLPPARLPPAQLAAEVLEGLEEDERTKWGWSLLASARSMCSRIISTREASIVSLASARSSRSSSKRRRSTADSSARSRRALTSGRLP